MRFRALAPPYDWIARVSAGLCVAVVLVGALLYGVTLRQERRRAETRACAAEMRAWQTREPFVAKLALPRDPCAALKMLVR